MGNEKPIFGTRGTDVGVELGQLIPHDEESVYMVSMLESQKPPCAVCS